MDGWIILGLFGQLFFGARFFVQWIMSEIKKRSYVPEIFWYLSVVGGAVLFVYALHKKDIVFIIGQGLGFFIYLRNIILIWAHRRTSTELVKEM